MAPSDGLRTLNLRAGRSEDGLPELSSEASAVASPWVALMRAAWGEGRRLPAEVFLSLDPTLGDQVDVAVRLIYEEICLREDAGSPVTPSEIRSRFPRWASQLGLLLDCHEALAPCPAGPAFPGVGDELGGFALTAELGRGAEGRVFLASQPALADRPVVVKVTPLRGGEHRSLARLQHTHVVPLLSAQDLPERGLRLICLPFLGGATLDRILGAIGDRPLSERTGRDLLSALDGTASPLQAGLPAQGPVRAFLATESYERSVGWIAFCLAEALHHAHSRGLVHLDVKPANVLVASDGMPFLLDFHLARPPLVPAGPPPDSLGGTPGYMPPEQRAAMTALREGRPVATAVDARADIYALGVLVYEALAGEKPPPGVSAATLRRRNPRVGAGLAALIARCLAADALERYRDASELAEDLRLHLDGRPMRGVPDRSLAERFGRWRRRRPAALARAIAAAAVVAAIAATGLSLWLGESRRVRDAESDRKQGRRHLDSLAYDEAARSLEHGLDILAHGVLPEFLMPQAARLRRALAVELDRARRASLADELHRLADRARLLHAGGPPDPEPARELERRLSMVWRARGEIESRLGGRSDDAARGHIREDLIDMAVLRAGLRVGLAGERARPDARREALRTLEEAEADWGPSPVLEHARKVHAEQLGLTDVARRAAARAARMDPRTAWEHYALGRSLLSEGELDGAARALDRAATLDPRHLWAQFHRGLCALKRGRGAEALDALGACVALAPDVPACYHNRGLAYEALGEHDRARRDFATARRLAVADRSRASR